jgi:hypothetical protein
MSINIYIDQNSRPTQLLTNEMWQKIFLHKKDQIVPYENGEKKKMTYKYSKALIDEYGKYLPDERTDYQLYCEFINSVLSSIRKGEYAYVFFSYQIEQLLHFHYDNLRTEYLNGYWKIWLERDR